MQGACVSGMSAQNIHILHRCASRQDQWRLYPHNFNRSVKRGNYAHLARTLNLLVSVPSVRIELSSPEIQGYMSINHSRPHTKVRISLSYKPRCRGSNVALQIINLCSLYYDIGIFYGMSKDTSAHCQRPRGQLFWRACTVVIRLPALEERIQVLNLERLILFSDRQRASYWRLSNTTLQPSRGRHDED